MLKIEDITNKIVCGDTLAVLRQMPDESVDCIITSPPYWALRDYSLPSQVWDDPGNCQHEWGEKNITLKHKANETNPGKEGWYKDKGASDDKGNNFCSLCGAWRGSLGLEPTFELYLQHLWQIFDEVKRVLKKTGTCWVNLGDSYNSHSCGQGNVGGIEGQRKNKQDNQANTKRNFIYPDKSLCLIPQRFVIGMTNPNWILREDLTQEEQIFVLTELVRRGIINNI